MSDWPGYKHCVSMRCDRREIVEDNGDHVVIMEHLVPDPNGPYLIMSNHDEPTWAARKMIEPRPEPRWQAETCLKGDPTCPNCGSHHIDGNGCRNCKISAAVRTETD